MDKKKLEALEQMQRTSLKDAQKYYKGFLYGDYGVGKTTTCGLLTRNKSLFVHTDRNYDVLNKLNDQVDKIDLVPYTGLSQLEAIGDAITEGIDGYTDIDLVVIDTISQVQEEYLDFLYDNYQWNGNLRDRAMSQTRGLGEIDVISRRDYMVCRDKMRGPIKSLIKAPVDVIFVAHLREPNKDQGETAKRPSLTEAVYKVVAREVNWIGLQERNRSEISIQFATDRKTAAKDSLVGLENKTLTPEETVKVLNNWKTGK